MSINDEIRIELIRSLNPLAPLLVKELRELLLRAVNDAAYLISFEVHPSSIVANFPVRWDWMEADLGQIDGGTLLADAGPLIQREHLGNGDPLLLVLPLLANWFADRWEEAGGHQYRLPAYIECQDGEVMFNLKERIWVDREVVYPDA